jgi:triosephosphate isomerase
MNFFIGANLKMNKKYSELKEYNLELKSKYNKLENIELMISPNFTALNIFSENKNISLWSQNMSVEKEWAFTGEVSMEMLKDLNCKYVILWHSEVRKNLGEDSTLINKKAKIAIENNIIPIICISKIEQFSESTMDIINSELIIAYEPIWSIWTGKSASISDISEVHNLIRWKIENNNTRIIYGWSVTSKNSLEISNIKNVNWFLIWWSSLKIDSLLGIINTIKK